MNFARHILGWAVGSSMLVACGGSTSSNGGDGGGTGGPCTIASGTYTQHFTAEAGGTNCAAIQDQTITINGSQTISGDSGSGPADGGSGCTTNVNSSTCTISTNCTILSGGFSSTISTTFTFNGSSATGKETNTFADSTGKVLSNCTYDITMTKN
jgi:hypothetical protein